ncbi:non-hydrolyzing UDP-N-acetylglucosamine 2-epimerase [Candidatus Venteria ishoeyi]|uniref:UDP-N-acetylglucosamine 2-epimerase (non-hydrolyzing) n=3 Tax=Candidatus Venteria ishoeyi TaxID=1899563 RepID=A0A1H6FCX0_9GAMM|nr:UDP-N-acetylglucosamine 2-epimerase (non-hydrolyzing) [Candidatus Venteria ishoeyi]MDM8545763.1 UDP-N-acetylglucosamine 2-epimerase (non-hydrolyzing) [Candidatus Venteria ishoeyi]SEH06884.1 UDP-N-acetylglucosamine 2-epimerase [Candidatus Venteria ishoeyi]
MKKIKVMPVFGTRPEAIKMAPVIMALRADERFETVVCATAQHRQMQDQALGVFGIQPDHDLNLMKPGQSLNDVVAGVLNQMGDLLEAVKPDWVLVQGDTSTAFAAGLAAFHARIAVGHVEAGLRSYQKYAPYPEEINRKMLSAITDLHFAPTPFAKQALQKEGFADKDIAVTGNTVIDALFWVLNHTQAAPIPELAAIPENAPVILVTGHRRENFGEGFRDICEALKQIAQQYPDYHIIYPVHLNPNVQKPVLSILGDINNIHLVEPMEYVSFIHLMQRSHFIISDSGGIQEESTALGKPVLVMRDVTERPEGVQAGVCQLVGTDVEKIVSGAKQMIEDENAYQQASSARQVFGDGTAAQKILEALVAWK